MQYQTHTPHKGHAPRYSQPLSTNQTPHPTTKMEQQQTPTTPEHKTPGHHRPTPAANATATAGLLSQSPIVCLDDPLTSILGEKPEPASQRKTFVVCTRPASTTENRPSHEPPSPRHPARCGPLLSLVVLLRKEVIQPHLPVRLPCYDFVPIADPTFDGSLHKG